MLRIGLVGCGHIGTVHTCTRCASSSTAVSSARRSRRPTTWIPSRPHASRTRGATAAPDLDALLDAVDVVWVCTWTNGHLHAVRGGDRGLPVCCEKPLAPTLDECASSPPPRARTRSASCCVTRRCSGPWPTRPAGRHGRPIRPLLRDDQYFPIQGMYGSTWRADVDQGRWRDADRALHPRRRRAAVDPRRPRAGDRARRHASGTPGIDDVAKVTFAYADGAVATLVSVWHQVTTRPSTRRLEIFSRRRSSGPRTTTSGRCTSRRRPGTRWVPTAPGVGRPPRLLARGRASRSRPVREPAKAFLDALGPRGSPPRPMPPWRSRRTGSSTPPTGRPRPGSVPVRGRALRPWAAPAALRDLARLPRE